MELVVKIDDKELESAILNNMKNLDQDQLSEIVLKAIGVYLEKDSIMESLIFKKDYWSSTSKSPNDFIISMLSNYDGDAVKDIQELIIDYMRKYYSDILFKAMMSAFSSMLISNKFSEKLDQTIDMMSANIKDLMTKVEGNR